MFQGFGDTVFVHTGRYIIGGSLYIVLGIAHRHSDTCMAKHADVVSSVSEGHGFFQREPEMLDELVDAVLLGISFGGNVHEGVIPTSKLTIRHLRGNLLLVFGREEGSQLVDFMAGRLFKAYLRKFLHTQEIVEDLAKFIVRLAYPCFVFAHEYAAYPFS